MREKKMIGNTTIIWNESMIENVPEEKMRKRRIESENRASQLWCRELLRQMERK